MMEQPRDPDVDLDDENERDQEELKAFLVDMFPTERKVDLPLPPPDLSPPVPSMIELKRAFKSKSAIIRFLYVEKKMEVNEIHKHTGIKYQMVRNVLTNELKRGPAEPFTLGEKGGLAPLLQKGR